MYTKFHHCSASDIPSAVLHPAGSPFLFTFTLSKCLKTWISFPFTKYQYHRFQFLNAQKKAFDLFTHLGRGVAAFVMGSGWLNVFFPQWGQGLELIQMVLGCPKSFRISSSSARHWANLLGWRIPRELKPSQGTGYSSWHTLDSTEACQGVLSMMPMERKFPHMLKKLSWKQWLRAGRMASSCESMIPHWSKYSSWSVAATFSSRPGRSSGLE